MTIKWSSFTKSITVKTTMEKLYHAFATRAGMERWFLRSCDYKNENGHSLAREEFAQAGDHYCWLWFGYDDDIAEKGKILQANGTDFLEFTFHANGKNDMNVSVSFTDEEAECRVNLQQYNIPTDEDSKACYFVGCGEGWTFYLANLKSVLEGGLDLRNKNEAIKGVINS
jgi:uncharacterized protein YndB with AHSA1/START domain